MPEIVFAILMKKMVRTKGNKEHVPLAKMQHLIEMELRHSPQYSGSKKNWIFFGIFKIQIEEKVNLNLEFQNLKKSIKTLQYSKNVNEKKTKKQMNLEIRLD